MLIFPGQLLSEMFFFNLILIIIRKNGQKLHSKKKNCGSKKKENILAQMFSCLQIFSWLLCVTLLTYGTTDSAMTSRFHLVLVKWPSLSSQDVASAWCSVSWMNLEPGGFPLLVSGQLDVN